LSPKFRGNGDPLIGDDNNDTLIGNVGGTHAKFRFWNHGIASNSG